QDGIDTLTQELQTNQSLDPNQKGLIYSMLGDLYNQVGLTYLAESYYKQGADLFEELENDLGKAGALAGLATVQWLNQEVTQAQQTEQAALQIYQEQGDLESQKKWQEILEEAKNREPSELPTQDLLDLGQSILAPAQVN
ncbi:MAG: hypothetical protein AB4058_01655, partial [Microcystaceae cyanobacterium]